MIGCNLLGKNGRLGNQMFQYAAIKGISSFHGYDFTIPEGPRKEDEFNDEMNQHKLFMAFKMHGLKYVGVVEEKNSGMCFALISYDEQFVINCPDNINLNGYFQSEKYFMHIKDEIRKDFEFHDHIKKSCNSIWKEIVVDEGFSEAISVHVRRTDYLEKSHIHHILSMSYYEEALSKLPKDIPVFVFTDDPQWAKENKFFSSDRFFISESDNICDMCLMSMCTYNVIANSTFSWWGAWLAGHNNVIAPKVWFSPKANLNDGDIVPDSWNRI